MFAKLLVANRGEIAVRIIQTCREMGIRSVAVYSEVDADALHVRRADEAYLIGPAPALQSYLRIEALLEVALRSGAEAIHPGYGFLAESAELARAVRQAGLVWIGPPPEAIGLMGDKIAAKALARASHVPVLAGYDGEDQTMERLRLEAEMVGYPLMIKAAAGGGGKGMRVLQSGDGMPEAVEAAKREARSAFGDGRVFLERLLVRPRHVEIQIMGDSFGNIISFGERDCSVQRRHQKVVEETPSPVLTQRLRTAMSEAAVRLARACGYVGAGTVEFLFAGDAFYFLEMNTRIQVEHGVTEMVTGLDLVRLQIEIAAGRPLALSQLEVRPRGHAIEARLYAEDAASGFLPSTGRLESFQPPQGPGIRNDVGVAEGMEVTPYYDPILAKLIVFAGTRAEALARLRAALERYRVLGVTTNLHFLHWVVEQEAFLAGRVDTDWVDREWKPGAEPEPPPEVAIAAAAFELCSPAVGQHPAGSRRVPDPWARTDGWRLAGTPRTFVYEHEGHEYVVEATETVGGRWLMTVNGSMREVEVLADGAGRVTLRERAQVTDSTVVSQQGSLLVQWRTSVYHLRRQGLLQPGGPVATGSGTAGGLSAPMPGTVVKVAVQPGERVTANQTLVVLEAMKMEHVIHAPADGTVSRVLYAEGDLVPAGSPVVTMEAL